MKRICLSLAVLLLVLPASALGHEHFVAAWDLPEPVDILAPVGLRAPAPGAGRGPARALLAASSGARLFLATEGNSSGDVDVVALPFQAEALFPAARRGEAAVAACGEGRAAFIDLDTLALTVPDILDGAAESGLGDVRWQAEDLNGDGLTDLWGANGQSLCAALQRPDGSFALFSRSLASPSLPVPRVRELWRVSAGRAAHDLSARSLVEHRIWADDLTGDGHRELVVLSEDGRDRRAEILSMGLAGFDTLRTLDLAALGTSGDAFLLAVDGADGLTAARLRLVLPGEEDALAPTYVLELFALSQTAAATTPHLRLTSAFLPGFMPLVRGADGWHWISLAPRLPATPGETARLAAEGTVEMTLRTARIGSHGALHQGQAMAVRLELGTNPRTMRGDFASAMAGRPLLVRLNADGILTMTAAHGERVTAIGPGAALVGAADVNGDGQGEVLVLKPGARRVEAFAWWP